MSRKRCCGQIDEYPVCQKFMTTHNVHRDVMTIGIEEMEAVRLKDVEGYDQITCAAEMKLTRPTFQRILISARKKIATALVAGQSIVIEGGHYQMKNREFECLDCGENWEVEPCTEGGKHGYEIECPKCGSLNKIKIVDGERHACGHGTQEHNTSRGCCCGH